MRLYLEVAEGGSKGQKFSLSKRTSLGRRGADILLNEPKLSGIHMYFDYKENEGWVLLDNDSRNGVWVNGMKEIRVVLHDGDEIQIGDSRMLCRLLEGNAITFTDKFKTWVQGLYKKGVNNDHSLISINPEIRLKVIQGIQYGETWDIFYGPRTAGRDEDDICLFDDKAPRDAFAVIVKGKYAYFYTENENIVKLNNKSVKERQLKPGDVISFGESEILVEMDEGHGFST